ncbi:Abi family protein [Lactococcus garvieae]|uniref:Abi family protein n=1 Tax=Lactococcus garvieae TaxID=1363 RepID=UPI00254B58F3|nr:Abi family protein [Lactococcus garvieae]
MKQFKSLDDQLDYLHKEKHVYFQDKKYAKTILLNCNYYNLISCGKVKYALDIVKNSHKYNPSMFEEWQKYFEEDCIVSQYLMGNMIEFERTINSRVAYYVGELIENNILKPAKKNEIIDQIKKAEIKKLPDYTGKETWKYITKMTFGETKELLIWLLDSQKKTFNKIIIGYDYLRTGNIKQNLSNIVELRNTLFHFTPLNVYLSFAKRYDGTYDNTYRKNTVNFIYKLNPDTDIKQTLAQIMKNSDNFVKIKNSQGLDQD